jgi:3-phenylpropionate/cinnamic acid dioxygenase small subunit
MTPTGGVTMTALSLQEISDRFEIEDLLTRYALAIDTKDWDLLDTCFVSEAHLDYTSTGGKKGSYPELRQWLAEALAPFAVTMHFISNISLRIEEDRAEARTYLWNPMGLGKDLRALEWFAVGAHYADELVRTEVGWRIRKRVQERAVMIGPPFSLGGRPR